MTLDYETLEAKAQMLEAENERLRKALRSILSSAEALMLSREYRSELQIAKAIKREIEEALR